ncbi:MAG: cation diffusion facilitator family transporter [Actinomycetaceae bacterium]|nr:cation diffusion facilitator family transporter [Actinomycetaceae bacterium]
MSSTSGSDPSGQSSSSMSHNVSVSDSSDSQSEADSSRSVLLSISNSLSPDFAAHTPEPVPMSSEDLFLPPPQPKEEISSTTSIIAAIIANIAVGIVKFIAAAISGSSAMIAEGIHSIVDSGNGLLVYLGVHRSKKTADTDHPFGYGQELYFWTLVVAILVFALGGGFSMYEGISRLLEIRRGTVTLGDPTMSYIVIVIAAFLEGSALYIALKNFNKARMGRSPLQFIREAKDPSLFTVVLEDTAAEMGLIVAFCGVFFAHQFNKPHIDAAASIVIGLLLAAVSVVLLRESKGLLIGEGLKNEELKIVEAIVESNPDVIECGRILSMYMGPHDLLMAIDATFDPLATRDDIVSAVDDIEEKIIRRFPDATRVFIESESLRFTRRQALHAAADEDAVE